MPGFDGTGPAGQGPRTGGGRGFCAPVAGQVPPNMGATPMAPPMGVGGLWNQMRSWWTGRGGGMGFAARPGGGFGRGRGCGRGRGGRW